MANDGPESPGISNRDDLRDYPGAHVDLRSDEQLHELFEVNERFSAVLKRWFGRGHITVPEHGLPHAQLMLVFALGKGYKTHRALLILCREGYGQDAQVLLRSLFELATEARYIAQDPASDRAVRWLEFDAVTRYEFLQVGRTDPFFADRRELQADPEEEARILSEAERVQRKWKFWKHRKKYGTLVGVTHWSGLTMRGLAQQVGWGSHYNTLYRLTSLLAHSSPRSAAMYIHGTDDGGHFVELRPGPTGVSRCLISGFVYLHALAQDWAKLLNAPESCRRDLAWAENGFAERASEYLGHDAKVLRDALA